MSFHGPIHYSKDTSQTLISILSLESNSILTWTLLLRIQIKISKQQGTSLMARLDRGGKEGE